MFWFDYFALNTKKVLGYLKSILPYFVFFIIQFSLLSLSVCNKWKKCIYYEMANLNMEKNGKIMC